MAFSPRGFPSSEEQYASKLIDYFWEIFKIDEGERKLQKVLDGEGGLLWKVLEGSDYLESKDALYAKIDKERKEGITYSKLHIANALCKLQQRAAAESGIFGKKAITVVTEKETAEETKKVIAALDELDENPEDAT